MGILLGLGLVGLITLAIASSRRRPHGDIHSESPEARAVQQTLEDHAARGGTDGGRAASDASRATPADRVTAARRGASAAIDAARAVERGVSLPAAPEGYDPIIARATAQALSDHLRSRGPRRMNRRLVTAFQKVAGIRADGWYGGQVRGALIYYGVTNPPNPFTGPNRTVEYLPPA